MTDTTPDQGDERRAFVQWLGNTFPHSYDEKDAEHYWQHGHVSALAWQAARALSAAQPVAQEAIDLGGTRLTEYDARTIRILLGKHHQMMITLPPNDVDRLKQLLAGAALAQEAIGTFNCPICGNGTPHHHSDFEQVQAMSEEQIDAELRALGIDPDKAAQKVKAVIDHCWAEYDRRLKNPIATPHHPVSAEAGKGAIPGWKWMTHPDWNNGQPIPVRIFAEEGVNYYQPFDTNLTDFEWDVRDEQWQEVSPSESVAVSAAPSAPPAQAMGEIVRWEWRHFDTANEPHTWSAWQVVEPRNPYTDTMADRVREYQGYIDAGYKYELRGLCVATPMPQPEPTSKGEDAPRHNWAPYLSDRADGVRGHFAIARWNTRGYREVWNLRSHQWSAFSDEVLTRVEAEKMLESITFALASQQREPQEAAEADELTQEQLEAIDARGPIIEGWRLTYEHGGRNGPGIYARFRDLHRDEDCFYVMPVSVPQEASKPDPYLDTRTWAEKVAFSERVFKEAGNASIGCSVSIVSDRTCECGTKGCVIKHEEASKVEAVADYQRGWKDGNDTANRAHAALAASPMFWVRLLADGLYEGPLHYKSADLQECRDANPSEWHPLHLHPAPQALSDAKDVARYRHIRSMAPKRLRIVDIETNTSFMEEHADEAIDAAILAAAGGSQ